MIGSKKIGHGPKSVVMIHDWFCDHQSYDLCMPFMDQEAFTYHLLDLRGYGLSKSLPGPYDLDQAFEDVKAYLEANFKAPVHLLGHSMSTLIVQKFLEKAPGFLASAVMVGPVPAFGMEIPEEGMAFLKAAISEKTPRDQVAPLVGMMTGGRLGKGWTHFKLKAWYETSTEAAREAYMHMFVEADFAASLEANASQTVPVLLITGQHDAEAHQKNAMETSLLKWFPHAKLVEISDSGHYPMQEVPAYFAAVVNQFHESVK